MFASSTSKATRIRRGLDNGDMNTARARVSRSSGPLTADAKTVFYPSPLDSSAVFTLWRVTSEISSESRDEAGC